MEGPGSNTSLRECPVEEAAEPSKTILNFVWCCWSPLLPHAWGGKMIRMQVYSWLRQEPSQHAGGPDIPELLCGKLPIYWIFSVTSRWLSPV